VRKQKNILNKKEKKLKKKAEAQEKLTKKIDRKKKELGKKYENLMKANENAPKPFLELLELVIDIMYEGKSGTIAIDKIIAYKKRLKEDKTVTEEQRLKITKQINEISAEIKGLEKRMDLIDLSKFKIVNGDFPQQDFTMFHGPITRSGPMKYKKDGKIVTYNKKWSNIQDVFPEYDYLPLKATPKKGAHYAEIKGYATNWTPHEDTEEMFADVILFNNLDTHITPEQFKKEYHVSMGYEDEVLEDNTQLFRTLDHLAMALGDERGRACTGTNSKGASCSTVKKIKDQNLREVVI
jgi:hypothetical protein